MAGARDDDDDDALVRLHTSWLLAPWPLFCCRALLALWAFFTIFFVIGWTCAHPAALGGCAEAARSFSYFTVLAFWGQAFYFAAAAAHTLVYARTGRPLLLARLPRPLPALHALLYSSVVTLPLVVTLVYWPLLFRPPWFPRAFDAWRNLSEHALNTAAALFELLVPRTDPLPWRHLPWLVLCMLAYLGLAFVTLAHQGFYTYRFLDHDRVSGRAFVAAYVLGIALGLVVVFAAVRGLIVLRRWLTESKLGMRGHFAHPPALAVDAEMDAAQPEGPLSKEDDAVA